MKDKYVFYGYVDIYDDVFTEDRLYDWKKHIVESYKSIYKRLKSRVDLDSPIRFYLDHSLLDEVIVDASIGMKKITDSSFNSVENPNAFKVISYLSYWWLRHKPVSIHYPATYRLDDINIYITHDNEVMDEEEERQKLIWQLKHINELVAVQMVCTYIFNFDKEICNQHCCDKIKNIEGKNFGFANFNDMLDVFIRKMTYYFSYRAIAPKMIEHLLEAYTFHPAWSLTGPQWSGNE